MSDDALNAALPAAPEEVQTPFKHDNVRQMKIAIATMAAAVVETLDEDKSGFRDRFLEKLDHAYQTYRDNSDTDPQHVLDTLHWTGELLRGWNPVPGREEPIFGEKPAADLADEF